MGLASEGRGRSCGAVPSACGACTASGGRCQDRSEFANPQWASSEVGRRSPSRCCQSAPRPRCSDRATAGQPVHPAPIMGSAPHAAPSDEDLCSPGRTRGWGSLSDRMSAKTMTRPTVVFKGGRRRSSSGHPESRTGLRGDSRLNSRQEGEPKGGPGSL